MPFRLLLSMFFALARSLQIEIFTFLKFIFFIYFIFSGDFLTLSFSISISNVAIQCKCLSFIVNYLTSILKSTFNKYFVSSQEAHLLYKISYSDLIWKLDLLINLPFELPLFSIIWEITYLLVDEKSHEINYLEISSC